MPVVIPARITPVAVSPAVKSSYDDRGRADVPRATLVPLGSSSKGQVVPEMALALLDLSNAVNDAGGDFRVTDGYRTIAEQAAARAKYDYWCNKGKPPEYAMSTAGKLVPNPAFDRKKMKDDFVAQPGRSGHNAGRAVDVNLGPLGIDFAKFRQIARGLGWRPITKDGKGIGVTEAWHHDYPGELTPILDRFGYETWALCGVLDIGQGGDVIARAYERCVQFHLARAGYDFGEIDGFIGPRTLRAVQHFCGALSMAQFTPVHMTALLAKPTAGRVLYPVG